MNISVPDDRWVIFNAEPNADSYKGFKLLEPVRTKPGKAQLSFSNDYESFTVYESSIEDAFIKAFDIIDTISD